MILWFVFLVKGGQVVLRSVFLLFFLLLQIDRFLEIFDLVLGQVQKGCFLVVVTSALTSISSMSKPKSKPGRKELGR